MICEVCLSFMFMLFVSFFACNASGGSHFRDPPLICVYLVSRGCCYTEAGEAVFPVVLQCVSGGAAAISGKVVVRTATDRPQIVVFEFALFIGGINVGAPFTYIAQHIVKTPGVLQLHTHGMGSGEETGFHGLGAQLLIVPHILGELP